MNSKNNYFLNLIFLKGISNANQNENSNDYWRTQMDDDDDDEDDEASNHAPHSMNDMDTTNSPSSHLHHHHKIKHLGIHKESSARKIRVKRDKKTAFNIFSKELRKSLRDTKSSLSFEMMSKEVGNQWRALSAQQRAEYEEKARIETLKEMKKMAAERAAQEAQQLQLHQQQQLLQQQQQQHVAYNSQNNNGYINNNNAPQVHTNHINHILATQSAQQYHQQQQQQQQPMQQQQTWVMPITLILIFAFKRQTKNRITNRLIRYSFKIGKFVQAVSSVILH